ncbi:MAG: cadmium-translocating P-type ATPase [Acidobacteria bacterium]|nr:cadmium-translocating P-type ATPase [Acidobacteriota bacterium]
MDKRIKFHLEGLDCASCAARIENSLKKEGFPSASVNFVRKEVTLEGNMEAARKVILRAEPGIRVTDASGAGQVAKGEESSGSPVAMIVAVLFFAAGLIFRYGFGINNVPLLLLFSIAYLLAGWNVLRRAFLNVVRGNLFDENFLMTIATFGAFAIGEFPEAAGVMIFFMVGEFFQDLAVNRSRRSVRSLLALKADYANLLTDGKSVRIRPEDLRPGNRILVRPGERIPVDGVVVNGASALDTSALTGESMPRAVKAGEAVLSGSVNLNGLLTVEVTKELKESAIARILELVENATARKAKTERFITTFARYYTPAVVGLAVLVALVPPLFFGAAFSVWIYRALVLLVISCPCALVLSIPLGYFGGIGKAAKTGILVKGSNFLDALSAVSVVAMDKTGTLTKGVFKVTDVVTKNGFSREELLKISALAELHSTHPIAAAVRKAWDGEINPAEVLEVEEQAGSGVVVRTSDMEIIAGNDRLLHKREINHDTCHVEGTVVHVAVNKSYVGYLIISDEIKNDSAASVRKLKALGVKKVVMVTGDSRGVAENIAKQAGVDEVYADLLPEDKVSVIEKLQQETGGGAKVAFVGDGINDAPVLAMADIGIAMGGLGSDAAIETADVVIMDDKPSKVAAGMKIARKTRRVVTQNIVLALGVKLVFIVLGVAGEATMWEAVFADVGVALLAVANALRILR